MGRYTLSDREMGGLTYGEVAQLFSTQDYLMEVGVSLTRDIAAEQRRSQLGNVHECVRLLDELAGRLPDPQLRQWAARLKEEAGACIFRVQGMIVFDELIEAMQAGRRPTRPAA